MRKGFYLTAALAPLVSAFANTSPLFLYSTENLPHSIQKGGLQSFGTGEQFLDAVKKTVSQCTSDAYILVLQPGIHESDFRDPKSAPQIRKFTETNRFLGVMDAVGTVDLNIIEDYVKSRCQAHSVTVDASTSSFNSFDENATAQVIKLDFPVLPLHGEARKNGHSQNDNFLSALISMIPSARYTVVYVSTPLGDPRLFVHDKKPEPEEHEHQSFIEHQSLLSRDVKPEENDKEEKSVGGLLSNYQFLTPALLWGILLGLFVFYVASKGVSLLSSIQVSYASFEKDAIAQDPKKRG
ncbi:hypothetical protein TWF679_000408 [Orbilia oligospora]|uniref:Protein BIG1 n=1 Tax=Orbilia oligospora TaxID=2813651 RepID=A0A8H8VI63_ORBOL|nr:hypothetical protein TWF679_000408 [Orbilia oligospora]